MAQRRPEHQPVPYLVAREGQPLIAIPDPDEPGTTYYFVSEEDAKAFIGPGATERALALAGVWSDLDWDEMVEALDRIRHESKPTPPIDLIHYLLDTGPLSGYLQGRKALVEMITPWVAQREVVTSVLVYGEVIEYLKRYSDFPRRRAEFLGMMSSIEPLNLDLDILERYADLRRQLRPPHDSGLIGDVDTLIAATALERNLTVVTTDSDFERVPSISVLRVPIR
jgi:tRNA(fMet)-specific endonuclease VapC